MNTLTHSPAKVVRQMLEDLDVAWPVNATVEANAPDNVVTVYNTSGQDDGRSMVDGELLQHYGLQVRVRGTDEGVAWQKVDEVRTRLAKQVLRRQVHLESSYYLVYAVTRIGQPISLGKDNPNSRRFLFTLNAFVALRQIS